MESSDHYCNFPFPLYHQRLQGVHSGQWMMNSSMDRNVHRLRPTLNIRMLPPVYLNRFNVLHPQAIGSFPATTAQIPIREVVFITGTKRVREREFYHSRFSRFYTYRGMEAEIIRPKQARLNRRHCNAIACSHHQDGASETKLELGPPAELAPCHASNAASDASLGNSPCSNRAVQNPRFNPVESGAQRRCSSSRANEGDDVESDSDESNDFESDVDIWLHCTDDWWKPEYVDLESQTRS